MNKFKTINNQVEFVLEVSQSQRKVNNNTFKNTSKIMKCSLTEIKLKYRLKTE